MIDLSAVDLDELAMALADQDGFERHWLIDPDSGQISLWTQDGGLDSQHPIDLDEVSLIGIHPLPSYVWYQDMADFAERISDEPVSACGDPEENGNGVTSSGPVPSRHGTAAISPPDHLIDREESSQCLCAASLALSCAQWRSVVSLPAPPLLGRARATRPLPPAETPRPQARTLAAISWTRR